MHEYEFGQDGRAIASEAHPGQFMLCVRHVMDWCRPPEGISRALGKCWGSASLECCIQGVPFVLCIPGCAVRAIGGGWVASAIDKWLAPFSGRSIWSEPRIRAEIWGLYPPTFDRGGRWLDNPFRDALHPWREAGGPRVDGLDQWLERAQVCSSSRQRYYDWEMVQSQLPPTPICAGCSTEYPKSATPDTWRWCSGFDAWHCGNRCKTKHYQVMRRREQRQRDDLTKAKTVLAQLRKHLAGKT